MNPIIVRNIKIGEGAPKICVPIVSTTKEEIISEAKALKAMPVDIVEWRVDCFEGVFEIEKVKEALAELREVLRDIPILFTFRTAKEGGEKAIELYKYTELNKAVAATGLADLIDVEIFAGDSVVKEIIEYAHEKGVKVVASNHDFHKTPDRDEIVRRLRRMQELGADIAKIALMPNSKWDVLTVMEATLEMSEKHPETPIITISMDGTGVISRLAGEVFGSAVTFGASKKASAPGQIAVEELNQVLAILHKSL